MSLFLIALVACALIFGGLLHVAEAALAVVDAEGVASVDALLRAVTVVATVLVPLLWSLRLTRIAGSFAFGFAVGALLTGPLFVNLVLAGRVPHL
ncbi:MAG: hypothetical protein KGM44_00820 [bacterium]|nr:hypothetical protein [bacterium]